MSLYRFTESSRDRHSLHNQLIGDPYASIPRAAANVNDPAPSTKKRLARSWTLPNIYNRRRTDAPATYVHVYELEIARWQARKGPRKTSSPLICSICLETMEPSLWIRPTALCGHEPRICEPCLSRYVEHSIRVEGLTEVLCPDIECRHEMDYEDLVLYIQGDAVLLNHFKELVAQRRLEQHPNFVRCTNPHCNRGQIHQEGASSPLVTCHYCHAHFCFTHRVAWHNRLTCGEYDALAVREGQNHASEEYIGKHAKRCPNSNCRRPIEKVNGCDHMTCRRPGGCGHEFCWVCLADYGLICEQGNHRHNSDCKHYAGISSSLRATMEDTIPRVERVRVSPRDVGRMMLDAEARLRTGQPPSYSADLRITGRHARTRLGF
ncbi:hypothetical protein B0J17DRAFT_684297 [Rhizoctonia solani]|nr:hypothetical protein B0J17DRAFT_684297 [Rhizoctonia solani]